MQDIDELIKRARYLSDINRHKEAISILMEAIKIEPEHLQVCLRIAREFVLIGNYDDCILWAKKSITLQPNQSYAYYLLALAYLEKGEIKASTENINNAISQNASVSEYYSLKARINLFLNRQPECIADTDRALELDSQNVNALSSRGLAWFFLENYNEALDCWNRALAIEPQNEFLHFNIGKAIAMNEGHSNEAAQKFLEALRLNPNFHGAEMSLGQLENNSVFVKFHKFFFKKAKSFPGSAILAIFGSFILFQIIDYLINNNVFGTELMIFVCWFMLWYGCSWLTFEKLMQTGAIFKKRFSHLYSLSSKVFGILLSLCYSFSFGLLIFAIYTKNQWWNYLSLIFLSSLILLLGLMDMRGVNKKYGFFLISFFLFVTIGFTLLYFFKVPTFFFNLLYPFSGLFLVFRLSKMLNKTD